MKNWWLLAISISIAMLAVPPSAADEQQTIVARVLDSSSERIPQLTVAPNYPRKARRDRIEGEVQVCFEIDRDGRTHRISVRNSTNRAFEKPSIAAVRASSFRPLGRDEVAVTIKFCRTFVFSLEPQAEE